MAAAGPRPSLLEWFAAHGRSELPWRAVRDPWAILVSEVMLQQTQVGRVVPRYEAFLARFPTSAACAAAPTADVIGLWHGLGYNRRAVSLQATARRVVEHPDGRFPAELAALLALPGVGPYTARALQAFAFELDVGVVDTNAARVLARVAGRQLRPAEAQARADAAVPAGAGWAWNQAMLDLGATVCLPRRPCCEACPLRADCAWAASGWPPPDPAAATAPRQGPFIGSDRQGRGRLVAALGRGPVAAAQLAEVMGWTEDADRAAKVAATVVQDGLATFDGGVYRLPR